MEKMDVNKISDLFFKQIRNLSVKTYKEDLFDYQFSDLWL